MSKQNVISFLQAISNQPTLTQKLKSITCSSQLLEIAAEYGYDFTDQELLAIGPRWTKE
ncbi:MAG: Nif11-like leader peptide family natural product precursor [Leptolyngbya sp. SIO4C1]|nr:Nif11-like leader peptide family natural product precursor [Leptolyngbya sp. SIO4C1]